MGSVIPWRCQPHGAGSGARVESHPGHRRSPRRNGGGPKRARERLDVHGQPFTFVMFLQRPGKGVCRLMERAVLSERNIHMDNSRFSPGRWFARTGVAVGAAALLV